MRYATTAIVLAAMSVGEAMAGPTHVHRHRQVHEKKDLSNVDWDALNWESMGVDWATVDYSKTSKSAASVATTAAAVATPALVASVASTAAVSTTKTSAAAASATSSESLLDDIEDLFEGLIGASNSRTTFGDIVTSSGAAGDSYYGNYGHPYGSNVIKVDSTASYSYTINFKNTQSKAITVNIWNKVGPDGQVLSGSALAPKNTTLTIALKAGASQIVAFDEDSEIAFAEAVSSTTASGAYDTTWGECKFTKTGSGYDMSAIMNSAGNTYNMSLKSVEAPECTSDMTQNYWLTATDPVGNSDGSCYIAQDTATLTVEMNGSV